MEVDRSFVTKAIRVAGIQVREAIYKAQQEHGMTDLEALKLLAEMSREVAENGAKAESKKRSPVPEIGGEG